MSIVFLIIALILLAWLGRSRIYKQSKELSVRQAFVNEYLETLIRYVESEGNDLASYTWLIRNANRMQLNSGQAGIFHLYQKPYEKVVYRNYQIFVNLPQDLRHYLSSYGRTDTTAREIFMILYEALQRYSARLDDKSEKFSQQASKPLDWLTEGTVYVLSIPFRVLSWIGLLGVNTVFYITNSSLLKIISKLIVVLGIVGTVVGLIVDWRGFITIVTEFINNIQNP